MYLDEIIKKFSYIASRQRILLNLKEITKYHRIQGSSGLVRASRFLRNYLESIGIDEVEVVNITKDVDLGLFKIPVEWDVFDAELWMVKPREKLLLKYSDHPTMVVAHSPPTNGWVEGEVAYVGKGTRSRDYEHIDVKGKYVLAYGNPREVYYEAKSRGALGIIVFSRRHIPYDAVPYYGLFFTEEEAQEANIIAISVSKRIAEEILGLLDSGERVVLRARIDAKYGSNPILPVILASIKGNNEKGFGVIAHYCHPMPGANDNASGVVGLLEVASILMEALRKGVVDQPKLSLYFMLVPEYYGTLGLVSLRDALTKNLLGVINLDMIGERQVETGSILTHVMSSLSTPTYLDSVVEYALRKTLPGATVYSDITRVLTIRYTITPYNDGSDHDVFISEGVPALLLNQWPDRFYHTDLDDIKYVDIDLIARIAHGVASSVYYVASIDNRKIGELVELTYRFYKWLLEERKYFATDENSSRILTILARYYSRGIEIIAEHYQYEDARTLAKKLKEEYEAEIDVFSYNAAIDHRKPNKAFEGIVSLWALRRINREVADKVKEILEKSRRYHTLFLREAINLANGERTVSEIYLILLAEYGIGAVEFKDLVEFYEALSRIGLIKFK